MRVVSVIADWVGVVKSVWQAAVFRSPGRPHTLNVTTTDEAFRPYAVVAAAVKWLCESGRGGAVAAAAAVGVAGMSNEADAAHIKSLALEPQHNLLGDRPGTLWVETTYTFQGQTYTGQFTSFPIGKVKDQQGNDIKTYLAIAMHGYAEFGTPGPGDFTISAIGDGNNNLTNRGRIFQNLVEEYRNPNFTIDDPWRGPNDIAIWSTTTSVPDSWIPTLAPQGSNLGVGETVFATGFSRLSTPGSGLLPDTGDSYGYFAEMATGTALNVDGGSHRSALFRDTSPLGFAGSANPGGSGGWVFNALDELVGMNVAVTGDFSSLTRSSQFADFTRAGYREQILPYAGIQVIPEPATAAMMVGGVMLLLRRQREESNLQSV